MYRIGEEEAAEVAAVIRSKQLFRHGDPEQGHMQECERFEQEWAGKTGTKYALLLSGGGTAALVCALAGMGIGPGDEVVVPAYTWLATATAVLAVGAIPVLAEIDETLALNPEDLERRIGPHTRAVIPVHMAGRPADMERILGVAGRHGLRVVEDSCQMVGGSYKGRRTGSWGDAGAFSFQYAKIITAGEGGALVTSDRTIYERAFIYHDSGSAFRPMASELSVPVFVAQQYRASEILGAVMRAQLHRLDGIIADLRRVRKRIVAEIAGEPGLRVAPGNDPEGDCGVAIALQFDSEAQARAFNAPEVGGYLGIDHGKHVFTNWEALAEKRVSHHPDMNPFNFARNAGLRMDYSAEACPRTLDLLRRTVLIGINPDWSESQAAELASALRKAARRL